MDDFIVWHFAAYVNSEIDEQEQARLGPEMNRFIPNPNRRSSKKRDLYFLHALPREFFQVIQPSKVNSHSNLGNCVFICFEAGLSPLPAKFWWTLYSEDMKKLLRSSVAVSLSLTALLSISGCGNSDELRLRVAEGRTHTYISDAKLTVDISGVVKQTSSAEIKSDYEMQFGKIRRDAHEVHIVGTNASINENGASALLNFAAAEDTLNGIKLAMTVDDFGQTRSIRDDGKKATNPTDGAILGAFTTTFQAVGPMRIVFPKKPLTPGLKWSYSVDPKDYFTDAVRMTAKPTNSTATYNFEVDKIDTFKGRRAAFIKTSGEGKVEYFMNLPGFPQTGSVNMKSSGTSIVDMATGLLLESTENSESTSDLGTIKFTQKVDAKNSLTSSID